jgi:pimeloyl-ACP methyl ester carboxylesterase
LRLAHDPAVTVPFRWPFITDFVLWHLWDRIDRPVLILRGAESDFLPRDTVRAMRGRGPAAAAGLVESAEFEGVGHAPALMSRDQIEAVAAFLLAPGPGGGAA